MTVFGCFKLFLAMQLSWTFNQSSCKRGADSMSYPVLDQLLAEIPPEYISKLEIYTFGSAASHMSNPPLSTSSKIESSSSEAMVKPNGSPAQAELKNPNPSTKPTQHIITHIEHYANEYDLVPRWGVLHSVYNIQNNRYAGSVFVRRHQSGHMFNQHVNPPTQFITNGKLLISPSLVPR